MVIQELPSTCSSFVSDIAELEAGPDCDESDVFLDITDVKFSDDQTILAVDSISTKPTVFDLRKNEMIFHENVVEDEDARPRVYQPIALSPDGSTVVYEIAGIDNSLPAQFKAVDVRTGDTIGLGATGDMSKTHFSEDGARLYIAESILFGLELQEILALSPLLLRWGKHLLLAVVVGQVLLAITTAAPVTRALPGNRMTRRHWLILSAATLLDLIAITLIFWVAPSVGKAPLSVVLDQPDYRILIIGMLAGVGWGVIRTALVATGRFRQRFSRVSETEAITT